LCGQVGIAGSAKLGSYVILAGHAGVRDNATIGNGVKVSAFGAVANDLADGETVAGIPAAPAREMYRIVQAQSKLPELLKRVKKLEARLESLDGSTDH
jgi:UDP-3-O-[3-hydroxymyristoyl] glucosamine N-acyltransferase